MFLDYPKTNASYYFSKHGRGFSYCANTIFFYHRLTEHTPCLAGLASPPPGSDVPPSPAPAQLVYASASPADSGVAERQTQKHKH